MTRFSSLSLQVRASSRTYFSFAGFPQHMAMFFFSLLSAPEFVAHWRVGSSGEATTAAAVWTLRSF